MQRSTVVVRAGTVGLVALLVVGVVVGLGAVAGGERGGVRPRAAVVPAPLAFATAERTLMDWVPTEHGLRHVHAELHELIGLVTGS